MTWRQAGEILAIPIERVEGTNTFGRFGFFLHGGRFPGSAGCVDLGGGVFGNATTDKVLNDLLLDADKKVPMLVH